MAKNPHVLQRLKGIQGQLNAAHEASSGMSSASKGHEREAFIDQFLKELLPTPFRFGTGDATDKGGRISGQLDVVIEYPFGPSLPIVGGARSRLYLAETVAAVVEVKSNVASQWEEAETTAKTLDPLQRSYRSAMLMGPSLPKIPLFVVGYVGWKRLDTVRTKLSAVSEVSGILVVDPGIFVSSQLFGSIEATGPWALWGLIDCLDRATGFLKAVSTELLDYATSPDELARE